MKTTIKTDLKMAYIFSLLRLACSEQRDTTFNDTNKPFLDKKEKLIIGTIWLLQGSLFNPFIQGAQEHQVTQGYPDYGVCIQLFVWEDP